MKRVSYIYESITDIQTILEIYQNQIRKNVKNKRKIENFEQHLVMHLTQIYNQLKEQNVLFHPYHIFLIKEPKYRIIMSQCIHDKIINHLVAKYFLLNVFEPSTLDCNVATRKNKGTSLGIKLVKQYINKLKKENKTIYYLKCDIKKYFYNVDHNKLKQILRTKIKDKKALFLLDKIIDTTNTLEISNKINKICQNKIKRINQRNIPNKVKIKRINELKKNTYV